MCSKRNITWLILAAKNRCLVASESNDTEISLDTTTRPAGLRYIGINVKYFHPDASGFELSDLGRDINYRPDMELAAVLLRTVKTAACMAKNPGRTTTAELCKPYWETLESIAKARHIEAAAGHLRKVQICRKLSVHIEQDLWRWLRMLRKDPCNRLYNHFQYIDPKTGSELWNVVD